MKTPMLSQAAASNGRLRLAGDARLATRLSQRVKPGDILWGTTLVPSWGRVFLAATGAGACRIELLHDADMQESLERVKAEHPKAILGRDDDALDPLLAAIGLYLTRPEPEELHLPVDAVGTEFQRDVWNALTAIPQGRPMTYGEVAVALGKPGAARAVGAACGANPVALAVPCHRVIAEDGRLGGYRWGKELKSRLLEMERSRRKEREEPEGPRRGRARC